MRPSKYRRASWLGVLALAALAPHWLVVRTATAQTVAANAVGELVAEETSEFSHIRIRQRGSVRSMLFVRDSGEEVLESRIDGRQRHVLQFEYLRYFFTTMLLREQQTEVLIVGLGGGGMVHFLQRVAPDIRIDAVEIDPVVVQLADKYFDVRSGGNVNVVVADGFKFLAETEKKYDVIYMDAFLKPSAETDGTGAPLNLWTQQFYKQMQQKLKPGGMVAFNLNPHEGLGADIREIREAFAQTYVFFLPQYQGAVVVGSTAADRLSQAELMRRGKALDRRYRRSNLGMRFEMMARQLQPQGR